MPSLLLVLLLAAPPPAPAVDWARYHDSAQAEQLLRDLQAQFPDLARLTTIGKSYQGRELWVLELSNRRTGPASEKPGYYVDGGVHACELAGSEQVLYLAWYFATRYGSEPEVTRLLDTRALYLRPKFNPDGSDYCLQHPDGLRSTVRPWDDDEDGLVDEDPAEDLDGDGAITTMRVPVPGGAPRELSEGIDNDGDGAFNEDGVGGIDMNRNFPRTWALPFEQPGAGPFPLSEPETRATLDFLVAHPNVTGLVHNHTAGGFLYRLPSTNPAEDHEADDLALVQLFGDRYTAVTGHPVRDSYAGEGRSRHGTLISWAYFDYGILGWVPEHWGGFGKDYDGDRRVTEDELQRWNQEELGGAGFAPWTAYRHPQLGAVEIGGWRRRFTQVNPPPRLLEAEIAMKVPWFLQMASSSPRVRIVEARSTALGGGRHRIEAVVENEGLLPTHVTERALKAHLAQPVRATLQLRGGEVEGPAVRSVGHIPGTRVRPGGPAAPDNRRAVSWVVKAGGAAAAEIVVASEKGGTDRRTLALGAPAAAASPEPADLVLLNARVHTLAWDEPAPDGTPAANAPRSPQGWRPDAEAVAIRGERIAFVGRGRDARAYRGPATRVIDLHGATLIPGLVDSHTHVAVLGEARSGVDLVGVETEAEAVARVAAFAARVPKGHWIVGRGWDEGAWANRYPGQALLSQKLPDHPVALVGLHSFAVWGNRLAFQQAHIGRDTEAPEGGEIVKDAAGEPSGILLNRATALLLSAIPPPTEAEYRGYVLAGLEAMAGDGYVGVHEAGADARLLGALQQLDREGRLPVRVSVMLAARDAALCREWLARGPDLGAGRMLATRSVKAFYDGALGSRGAWLLEDYFDRPGQRGRGGKAFGFDPALMADMMKRGFQAAIHAIGDAANREALDFIESVAGSDPQARARRHRIEHAQVLQSSEISRFASLGVIASMEPPHAVEDKGWAEARLGPVRVKGAYAWRSLRRAGARLALNSDLAGSDHDIFYGLHSAITRRDKSLQPPGGWYPEQRLTPEEALRGYTAWNAYAGFHEDDAGVIAPGHWADLTALDVDPLAVGEADPAALLRGKVLLTVVAGRVRYQR
jgi:predicted amidohydrolase YtcJ